MTDSSFSKASILHQRLPVWFSSVFLVGLVLVFLLPFLFAKDIADRSDQLMMATSAHAYVCDLAISHIEATNTMPQSWSDLLSQESAVHRTSEHAHWQRNHEGLGSLIRIDFNLVPKAVNQRSLLYFTHAVTLKVDDPDRVPRDEADRKILELGGK